MKKRFFLIIIFLVFPFIIYSQTNENTEKLDKPSRDMAKEEIIWQELKTPDLINIWKKATEALDKDDYQTAAQLYEKVLVKSPKFDAAMRRLGSSYLSLGKRKEALELLEQAVKEKSSPENLISLAQALAFSGENQQTPNKDLSRAFSLAQQAERKYTGNDPSYTLLVAQLAFNLENNYFLCESSRKLIDKHSDLMPSHYFMAICSFTKADWVNAKKEIRKAQELGLEAKEVERILALINEATSVSVGNTNNLGFSSYFYYAIYLVIAWIAGLVLLFILGKVFSRLNLQFIETADPNLAASPKELSLRKYYRMLINISSIYYYLSMPVVMFLVITIVGSILYFFLWIGTIPIKLFLFIALAGLMTVIAMVRSFFIKIDSNDPGRELKQDEAPKLWELTREVAKTLGTRPIDEIRVTPGTDIAVYEKGSFREKSQDKAKRVLILGIGILNGFDLNAFRAVLAHEYGHFSNRDTAGGDIALRVRQDMTKFVVAIALNGQAVWWNIAYLFLQVYDFIFRRISFGATRLQEVLADRIAALNYSPQAFETGLRHVIRCEVEFSHLANQEIDNALATKRSLSNLYDLKATLDSEQDLNEQVNKIIAEKTSEDDTHPSPIDRFRYISRINSKIVEPSNTTVWELFADREAITKEMSTLVELNTVGTTYLTELKEVEK
ncbi:MAG: M48 family metalloprotease [Blastocatellia bacterium]|nr:M48 family metalloprotease [Blastocatellia bacterium]MBL8193911.1 M48 family metalloprotease [Blastocatellia bacterium]